MTLVFDVGKTNKKCIVFDAQYRVVWETSVSIPETVDEDGHACEDLAALSDWLHSTLHAVMSDARFQIDTVNCTAYGASFVHLDQDGRVLTPLYNYLKPYPDALHRQFFDTWGAEQNLALETASPVMDSLNSGLQLYRLKYEQPQVFEIIKWSVHLPQYVAWLLQTFLQKENKPLPVSEITSIGCHTLLWDFIRQDYHRWVYEEGMERILPPITNQPGMGLHDSSAALIPYLATVQEPFLLLSTGTWCISMNPFNTEPLTAAELEQDCLCYLTYEGKPVKSARYFGGHEHEKAVQQMAREHQAPADFYKKASLVPQSSAEADYLRFMTQLIEKQAISTQLAIGQSGVRTIFVDGGFSKNEVYMRLLSAAFPHMNVFAAEVAQATALGAALAVHVAGPIPPDLIAFKPY
ncbi:MAG: hypothetical protein JNM22_19665 [Saprospiraceae bacterium]|nr:hypothetical protein [Saprospiraceae bacterium]